MDTLKNVGAIALGLLAVGTLPSAYLIAEGLLGGVVPPSDVNHFAVKLVAYFAWIAILSFGSYRLWKSGRSQ